MATWGRHGSLLVWNNKRWMATKAVLEPLDRILLHGLVFHGKHGVYPEENVLGQKFEVDVELSTDLRTAGRTDDLQHSVNYAQVYDEVKTIVEGPPKHLIEAVAEDIARTILKRHPRVQDVVVRVSKPHVAVVGVLDSLGIEITRGREQRTS